MQQDREQPGVFMTGAMPRTPASRARLVAHPEVGLLVQPESHLEHEIENFAWWGADNGCFGLGRRGLTFDPKSWLAWLDTLPRTARFVTVPDVLEWHEIDGELVPIGNAQATLELFPRHAAQVRGMGFVPALVLQDGLEMTDEGLTAGGRLVRWEELGAVFVGGSDEFKESATAAAICREARARGLFVHVGRMGSARKFRHAVDVMGAHSVDSTFLAFGPDKNMRRLMSEPSPKTGRVTRWLTPENELAEVAA